ncbi:CHASE2 domain-containing protein [Carboxylicivirga caseinilyticus]|uniref:CHASE2 domain-containing protein n=1 Tax=Carboxylicivirga caseinilyticus TaxID=3417572 RepID=UPI003D33D88B|nr:CHASE2 domain-containing protein [Marinilabiliaceae bacterium A049]
MIFQPKAEGIGTWGNVIKNIILNSEKEIDSHRFLFVNTSSSNTIIQNEQPPFDNSVIVNREMLASFLNDLKETQNYKYVIADIIFEDQSDADSLLQKAIDSLPRFITCSYTNNSDEVIKPIFNANCGLCDIETINGTFLKYNLKSDNGVASLPLKVYNELNQNVSKKRMSIELNSFILNFRITKHDINSSKYTLTDLCSLVFLGKDAIQDLAKDRIIVIGDFKEHDNVSTTVGEIQGPLILTNVILALENKDHIFTTFKFFVLFLGFFLLSCIAIYPTDIFQRMLDNIDEKRVIVRYLVKSAGIGAILLLCSILYYVVFNIYLNIIYLGGYFLLLDSIANNFTEIKAKILFLK